MDFKDILQDLLNSRDMKPADLCRETGIPTSLMSNYLKGTKSPGTDNSIKIATVFNISLDELAGRKKEKPIPEDELSQVKKELIALVSTLTDEQVARVYDLIQTALLLGEK